MKRNGDPSRSGSSCSTSPTREDILTRGVCGKHAAAASRSCGGSWRRWSGPRRTCRRSFRRPAARRTGGSRGCGSSSGTLRRRPAGRRRSCWPSSRAPPSTASSPAAPPWPWRRRTSRRCGGSWRCSRRRRAGYSQSSRACRGTCSWPTPSRPRRSPQATPPRPGSGTCASSSARRRAPPSCSRPGCGGRSQTMRRRPSTTASRPSTTSRTSPRQPRRPRSRRGRPRRSAWASWSRWPTSSTRPYRRSRR
mmetsp:Transcript_104200/g.294883  ORF Transcript_104200/g.294883 Transcript_104200/m.294883 type:complete len:250 (-) Transcript_104200:906-1655(-)